MNVFITDLPLSSIREAISLLGVAVISAGALRAAYQLYMLLLYQKFDINFIRLQFVDAVLLGLEFIVGSDIIGSLIAPDYYNVGLLAIIVAVRTVLSYFLNLELRAAAQKSKGRVYDHSE